MSRFKFRAWDGKKMHYLAVEFKDDGLHLSLPAPKSYKSLLWLMFTSMVDTEGVDIYEGDLVEVELDVKTVIDKKEAWSPAKFLGFVEYVADRYVVTLVEANTDPNSVSGFRWDRLKVVGNLFENKEMLPNGQTT